MSGKAILRAMHVVVAEGPGLILLTNSPGWDFMSEIGLPGAGSNEASRQNNKIYAWCYCFYQKFYFFRSYSLQLTHWLMTHDSLTHWLIWLIKHPFSIITYLQAIYLRLLMHSTLKLVMGEAFRSGGMLLFCRSFLRLLVTSR